MSRTVPARQAHLDRRLNRLLVAIAVLVGGFLLYATIATFAAPREESRFDPMLPNPMGGPAQVAPGEVSGTATMGDLRIDGVDVAMGDVDLGITYVPGWTVTNPSATDVRMVVGQPQVLEGCCPGPIYADGELTQAGQELTVPATGSVTLQFPLQMHPGMDGPHHLAVPLAAGEHTTALHVTGDFGTRG
jgi:hypothetical protein